MNIMAHLAAMVAILWMSVDLSIGQLGETELGAALLILFFMFLVSTVFAVADDMDGFISRRGRR